MHKYNKKYQKDNIKVVECIDCGFIHHFPSPTQEELDVFYKDYFEESTPSPNFNDKFESFVEYIGGEPDKRILDVGAWDGDFLELFKNIKWERVGIEPNRKKRDLLESMGIIVFDELFQKIDYSKLGKFDAINFSFVLEHVLYPKDILQITFDKLLKSSGVICVEVPNDFNPLQDAIVESLNVPLYWLDYSHINYFNVNSLEALIKSIGYEVLLKEVSFPVEFFALSGDNYIGNHKIGRIIHRKRLDFEENLVNAGLNNVKRKIYQTLAEINIGRSIMIFAKKP